MKKKEERQRWNVIIDTVGKGPLIGAELGVCNGYNARRLLTRLPNLTLYLVDRWQAYTEEQRKTIDPKRDDWMPFQDQEYFDAAHANAVKLVTDFPGRAIIVRMPTVEAVSEVPDELDFVFVDADHEFDGVKADINAWLPKIKKGGYMIGHDYSYSGVRGAVWDVLGFGIDSANTWKLRR